MVNKKITIDKLTSLLAIIELKYLSKNITKYNKFYHSKDTQLISDIKYDKLMKRHSDIEKKFPKYKSITSPSNLIGFKPLNKFSKIIHNTPMLSLDNAFNKEDVINFYKRIKRFLKFNNKEIKLTAEPKIDGLSASLCYKKGVLVSGATRGDGKVGEDVTFNLKAINDIPHNLFGDNIPNNIEIRGEVYINRKEFNILNKYQKSINSKVFTNLRNAAAGSIRQLDSKIVSKRNLRFIAYTCGNVNNFFFKTQVNMIKQFKRWGFIINPFTELFNNIDELLLFFLKIEKLRLTLDYDIDGVVYKVNNLNLQERLGCTSRAPRWAIAHKFVAKKTKTIVTNIKIKIGRTGAITPVACLKPVAIDGVIISNATLYNEDEIIRKDIRIGDTVIIQRSGDVIPKIVKVILDKRKDISFRYKKIKFCPECNSKIIYSVNQKTHKKNIIKRCSGNLSCKSQIINRLWHFISHNAFDFNGLGLKQIKQLYEWGIIKDVSDIFNIEKNDGIKWSTIKKREGWGNKSVDKLFKIINDKRKINLDRFIFSLGIRHIGKTVSQILACNYKNINYFLNEMKNIISIYKLDIFLKNNSYTNLISLDGIGKISILSLINFFSEENNLKVINKLLNSVSINSFNLVCNNSYILNKNIVFTGLLKTITRSKAKIKAENLGAKVIDSVSKNTDLLIVGQNPGNKFKKAKFLNIKILTEKDWIILIKNKKN